MKSEGDADIDVQVDKCMWNFKSRVGGNARGQMAKQHQIQLASPGLSSPL